MERHASSCCIPMSATLRTGRALGNYFRDGGFGAELWITMSVARGTSPIMVGGLMVTVGFNPVIKVRAVQLYLCRLLLCKRNFSCLRRGR